MDRSTAKLVNRLTAMLVNCLTATLVNRLTAKLVVVNLVKLHLTELKVHVHNVYNVVLSLEDVDSKRKIIPSPSYMYP